MTKVWIAYNDRRKDFSKAEDYGELRDVFSSVGKNYNPDVLIEHARTVLSKAEKGDYLLVVGDPSLVAICTVAMSEVLEGEVKLLRWDRNNMTYYPLELDFDWRE
jgi:hypothetical protein